MDAVAVPDGYVSGSFEAATSLGSLTRRVIRRDAPGPTVILIHELPGLSASTFAIADELIPHGYRIVLPILLDAAWTGGGMRHQVASMVKLCVARELLALSADARA